MTDIRLFGKPTINGKRRLGVALAQGETVDSAVATAQEVARLVDISIDND